jgi:hypothetical protein
MLQFLLTKSNSVSLTRHKKRGRFLGLPPSQSRFFYLSKIPWPLYYLYFLFFYSFSHNKILPELLLGVLIVLVI